MRKKVELNKSTIISQYSRGLTIVALMKMYHTSYYNIAKIIKENNVHRQSSRKLKSITLYNNIFEDYCSGITSYKLLSNKHNVTRQIVAKAMRINGVHCFNVDKERKNRVIFALQQGEKQSDIAKKEKVSRQLISRIAKYIKTNYKEEDVEE